jgi:acyl-coenzyme A thioesterase PaaI-like protein
MTQLTGLEFLEAIGRGDLPPAPMATLLGIEPVEVSPGRAVFAALPSDQLYNPMGVVHGGFAATILDATAEGRLIAERTGKLLAHGTTTCVIC